MRICLQDLPAEGVEFDCCWKPGDAPELETSLNREDIQLVEPVTLQGRMQSVSSGVLLNGWLTGRVTMPCSRCLEPAQVPLQRQFWLTLVPASNDVSEALPEQELAADDLLLETVAFDQPLEWDWILREQLLMALPPKPLCREECAGLCSECGANRNETACQCAETKINPQFAALKDFKVAKD